MLLQIQAVVKKYDILFIADEVPPLFLSVLRMFNQLAGCLWLVVITKVAIPCILGNLCIWKIRNYVWL